MISRRTLLAGAGILTIGSFTNGLLANPAHAKPSKGIKYGGNSLDVYPALNQSRALENGAPVVVFVHGGAWRLGNKSKIGAKADYFTKRGYTFVSIGYTLYPRAKAHRQADQVGQAMGWIQTNIARFGGDPERVALMGHSAGSHLVALATLSGRAPGVKALICNDTRAYDLPFLAGRNGGRVPTLYSALREKKNWVRWSPISYVSTQSQPATMVAWSSGKGRDEISLNFVRALEGAGVPVKRYDGSARYNHLSINSKMGNEKGGVTAAVAKFIEEQIG